MSLRLCLHDRDFLAGQRITENIFENVSKSHKVSKLDFLIETKVNLSA